MSVTQADGLPMQPTSSPRLGEAGQSPGLPRLRFHDLRHAHATHLLASGVHPKVASERLGHSKVGITLDLYSHVMPGMQEDAVAKVDAAFRAARNLHSRSGFDGTQRGPIGPCLNLGLASGGVNGSRTN